MLRYMQEAKESYIECLSWKAMCTFLHSPKQIMIMSLEYSQGRARCELISHYWSLSRAVSFEYSKCLISKDSRLSILLFMQELSSILMNIYLSSKIKKNCLTVTGYETLVEFHTLIPFSELSCLWELQEIRYGKD